MATLSLPRRLAPLEWAESTIAWILEDDYAGEFRYSGAPLPPLLYARGATGQAGRARFAQSWGRRDEQQLE